MNLYPTTGRKRHKRNVYIVAYRTMTCPVCHKVFDDPNSAFNKAIEKVKEDPNIELILKIIIIDEREPVTVLMADEAGVEYVPTIFINGNKIPNKYIFDYNTLLNIIYGRMIPTEREEPSPGKATFIGRLGRLFRK